MTVVSLLVGVVAIVNVAAIPNDLAYISSLESIIDGDLSVIADLEDQEDLRSSFGVLSLVSLIAAGVAWVMWQQRARSNAAALGAGGQRHTNALAAASWIVPIANFFLPKQVTDDLWRGSDPEAPRVFNVQGRPVWSIVNVWWALWIVGGLLGRFLLRTEPVDDISEVDELVRDVRLEIFSQVLVVVAAVLAIMIVRRVTERLAVRATNASTQLT
ncbi:MAG: DUF4328 domain-containing protein [Actinomycetota bacterium]